jgi:uncharacterized protein YndB with AHSA1/START domain
MGTKNEKSGVEGHEPESEREIVVTRMVNAPRELVYEVWTKPEHVKHWWGPDGFTNTIISMDVKPGGAWQLIMHGPDGVDYPNLIEYIDVIKNTRLEWIHGTGEANDPRQFHVTVTFESVGTKTKINMRMLFQTVAALEKVVKEFGALEGNTQTLNRMEVYLSKMPSTANSKWDLRIMRIIEAPRERVFQAWTDPTQLAQWLGPEGCSNKVTMETKPDGLIRIDMYGPEGTLHPLSGRFKEISAPSKLIFTASALDENGNPIFENLNTVTFTEESAKTLLSLEVRVISVSKDAAQYLDGMYEGWKQGLDRLIRHSQKQL